MVWISEHMSLSGHVVQKHVVRRDHRDRVDRSETLDCLDHVVLQVKGVPLALPERRAPQVCQEAQDHLDRPAREDNQGLRACRDFRVAVYRTRKCGRFVSRY